MHYYINMLTNNIDKLSLCDILTVVFHHELVCNQFPLSKIYGRFRKEGGQIEK